MKPQYPLVVIILIAGLACTTQAAGDPQPVANAQAPAVQSGSADTAAVSAPAAGLADLPENQAELEAIRRGELKLERPQGVDPAPVVDAAREARRAAYDAVLAEQDARIRALADRLAGAAATDVLIIQRQIEQEKVATSRRLLEMQLEMAIADGDQPRVQNLEQALAAWDAPVPVGTPAERPRPVNPGR